MNYTALDARAVGRRGFKPYRLARMLDRPSPVELISWPFPTDDGGALRIKIRLRPGDSRTLAECSIGELYLLEETCADCGELTDAPVYWPAGLPTSPRCLVCHAVRLTDEIVDEIIEEETHA